MSRFEVLGLDTDKELIRLLAKLLAEKPESAQIRSEVLRTVSGEPPSVGGIVRALLGSPFAASNLDLSRPFVPLRKVDI